MRAALAILLALAVPAEAAPFAKSGIADWTKPPAAGPERAFAPPVATRLTLGNGLAVLVVENHALPIVALELVVPGAGVAADPARRSGLAAFTADLLDEGAAGMSSLALAEATSQLGAQLETAVDTDAARLSATTLTRTFEPTLALLAKLVTQPTFAAGELTRLKSDRLAALARLRDRPPQVSVIVLQQALYGLDSGYGHPGDGVAVDVQAITVADIKAFYRAHWVPAGATLVIAGDVDAQALKPKLEATLGGWRGAATAATRPAAATAKPNRLLLVDRPGAAQSDVAIGLIGPARSDPRFYAYEVAQTIIGGGFTGRITQRLREQLGIIYHASTRTTWLRAPGPFVIQAPIATPATATGLSEILKIVDDIATHDVPAGELDKARQSLMRALPSRFESNAAVARAFAALAALGLPDDSYATYADGIRAVTAADVHAAAGALLSSGKLVFAVVGDLAKIQPSLDALGLGAPARYDLDARPR